MPELSWNTYRSRDKASAPVAEVRVERSYELRHRIEPKTFSVRVGDYEEAEALYSGDRWTSGNRLPSEVMGTEPVLIKPEERGDILTEWVWAKPQFPSGSRYTHHDQPRLVSDEEVLVVPHVRSRAPLRNATRRPAQARGNGVYTIAPGFRKLRGVLVNGKAEFSGYHYDPLHGALYIEQSKGTPIDRSARVEVFVDREDSMRIDLREKSQGEHPVVVGDDEEVVSEVRVDKTKFLEDNRRLPVPEDGKRWHAIDYGQYDGRPIPSGSLWIIKTDAPSGLIEDAVDRVMPGGILYRTEPKS